MTTRKRPLTPQQQDLAAREAAPAAPRSRQRRQAEGADVSTQGPADRGQRSSNFSADRDKQVTQTVGVNPDPPANYSASVPGDSVPPYPACLLGPYTGLEG